MHSLIVTLDGPAGSGKSTVARQLACHLGLRFLDTGAMYRGLAALCIDRGLETANQTQAVIHLARRCEFRFDWAQDPPRFHAVVDDHEIDLTDRLRDADTTRAVSDVAALGQVRLVMVAAQQQIGREHPWLVTEGRDQGSVVFPNAAAKFYLEASPAIRAKRRVAQLREAGKPANQEEILAAIIHRDHRDSTREDGPLICPPDAMRLDTSDMSLQEVVAFLEDQVRQQCGAALAQIHPPPSDAQRGRCG